MEKVAEYPLFQKTALFLQLGMEEYLSKKSLRKIKRILERIESHYAILYSTICDSYNDAYKMRPEFKPDLLEEYGLKLSLAHSYESRAVINGVEKKSLLYGLFDGKSIPNIESMIEGDIRESSVPDEKFLKIKYNKMNKMKSLSRKEEIEYLNLKKDIESAKSTIEKLDKVKDPELFVAIYTPGINFETDQLSKRKRVYP